MNWYVIGLTGICLVLLRFWAKDMFPKWKRHPLTPGQFAATFVVLLACAVAVFGFWLPSSDVPNFVKVKEPKAAAGALTLMKDTAVWMAGLQTATLTALGFLAKDGLSTFRPEPWVVRVALAAAILNTGALFCSAWVLTALPSISLRTNAADAVSVDFFNYPLYAFMPEATVFTFGYLGMMNHWLWAFGTVSFGVLGAGVFLSRVKANAAALQPPQATVQADAKRVTIDFT